MRFGIVKLIGLLWHWSLCWKRYLKKIHRTLFQRDYTEILREIQLSVKKDEHR